MKQESRKVFDVNEQRAKDVFAAIKTIVPVISIIREWGKFEQECNQIAIDNKKLFEEMKAIKQVIELTCTGGELEASLSKVLKEKSDKYNVSTQKAAELQKICNDMQNEVCKYQLYSKSFNYINNKEVIRILLKANFDKEEFLSMLFLVHSVKVSHDILGSIHERFVYCISEYGSGQLEEYQIEDFFYHMNSMLMQLKLNKI